MADTKSFACIFFRKGTCRNGDTCSFSHDPNAPDAPIKSAGPPRVSPSKPRPAVIELKPGSVYVSIDVECVATSKEHNSRATAQIALVSQQGEPILNLYVKPDAPVASYLEPLTSLNKELLEQHGMPLAEAMAQLRSRLPKNAILVGQNIGKDVEWLQLKEGEDFAEMIDLAALFRVWNDKYRSYTYFGLDHAATCWMGQANDGAAHNAVTDAVKSMQLFNLYIQVQHNPPELARLQGLLLSTPVAPSFAKKNPEFEGCCMGNRKTCTCGAPFFS
mmetsp:Transcript_56608/g.135131  ORF Transcript_56608/g.135131 Transcript_56608/m.135131 type:complete len:275 (+) Transcript_56608:222-1046(+)